MGMISGVNKNGGVAGCAWARIGYGDVSNRRQKYLERKAASPPRKHLNRVFCVGLPAATAGVLTLENEQCA